MRLKRYTDYGLRILMYLAVAPGRIEEIASAHGISRGHVMKISRQLSVLGFVASTRGRGGGLRLARPANQIQLGEVVRGLEQGFALVECFGGESSCVIEPACGLRDALDGALTAFFAVLDDYTLEDLVRRPRQISQLLQIV